MTATIDPARKVRAFSRRALMTPVGQDGLAMPPSESTAPVPPRVAVTVNLLPTEITEGREARAARLLAVVLILAAVLGTGSWAYHVHSQVSSARADLAAAQAADAAALAKQSGFSDLKKTQADIAAAQSRATTATNGALDWSRLVPAVYDAVPDGIEPTSLAGQATTTTGGSGAGGSGSLIISGTSPSKGLVSAFALKLGSIKGLQNPFVTSVSTDDKGLVTFSIQVSVTDQAIANRFAKGTR